MECSIIVITRRHIRLHKVVHFSFREFCQREYRPHFQPAVRDRSRLIQTERIYVGQCLQRIDILHKYLHPCQPDHTGSERDRDQQHKPFRQHAKQGG